MKIVEKNIQISRTLRYYSSRQTSGIKEVWFVLHGYRQTAERFIKKFAGIDRPGVLIVSPEGLHRFYLSGYDGRVGNSWMTSEAREADISDYVTYLDQVWSVVKSDYGLTDVKLNVVGFSQGAATATRWTVLGESHVSNLVLWSGVFPPDLPFKEVVNGLSSCVVLVGDQDEFISNERIEEEVNELKNRGIDFELIRFSGKHDVYEGPLLELRSLLNK